MGNGRPRRCVAHVLGPGMGNGRPRRCVAHVLGPAAGKRQEVRAASAFACSASGGAGSSFSAGVVALGAARLRKPATIAPASASAAEMPAAMRQPLPFGLSGSSRCADECSAAAPFGATVSCSNWPVLAFSQRLVVLVAGRKIADGDPQAVVREQAVVEAYLGS